MTRAAAVAVLALLCGCAASKRPGEIPSTGVVRGQVRFIGLLPKQKVVFFEGVPGMPAQGIPRDDVVLDAQNNIQWVLVFVRHGLEGKSFEPDPSPVVLEQVGMMYRPHVLGVRTGQPLAIHNLDRMKHSVHAYLPYSRAMPIEGRPEVIRFSKAKIMEALGCDIHPWMKAWVAVMDHPFFAVTDASGRFEIGNLPQGRYTLGFWHERFQAEDQEIDVSAGGAVEIRVDLK